MKNTTTNYDSLLIPPGMQSQCNRLRITRICKINEKGYLVSPTYETVWKQPVMVAHKWSKSKALLGKCGLHGIWYHHDALPKVRTHAVVHCLGDGRAIVSERGCRVERQAIQEIVLHPKANNDLVKLVKSRYPEVYVKKGKYKKRVRALLSCCGALEIISYRNGKRHGKSITYYPNGDTNIRRFRHGKLHGRFEHRTNTYILFGNYYYGKLVEDHLRHQS